MMFNALARLKANELIERLRAIPFKPEAGVEFDFLKHGNDVFLCILIHHQYFTFALSWLWDGYHELRTYDRSIEFLVKSTVDLLRRNDALIPNIGEQIVAEYQQAKG